MPEEHLDEDWIDEDIWLDSGDDLEPTRTAMFPGDEAVAAANDANGSSQSFPQPLRESPTIIGMSTCAEPLAHHVDSDGVEEKQCRICFGSDSPEEVEELGRLISPCLCSGTMSYVHVKCINEWRSKGRNKQTYYQCNQCHFRYRFNRTLFFGLATSRPLIFLTSMFLFLFLALATGQVLLMLLNSSTFDRWIRRPIRRAEEELERQTQMTFGSDTTTYGWGIGYGSMSGGLLDIVIRAVNVFASGEAEEVMVEGLRRVAEVAPAEAASKWSQVLRRGRDIVPAFPGVSDLVTPILTRLSLGFSFIGSLSFVSLLISSSLLAPFQLANNLRFGRFGWGRVGRRRGAPEGGVGLGTVLVVIAVCAGAIRCVQSPGPAECYKRLRRLA